MEQWPSSRKISKEKNQKLGPHLPPYIWRTAFPQAELIYLADVEKAAAFLGVFGKNLYKNAIKDGDAVLGFDVEWRPREASERESMDRSHKYDILPRRLLRRRRQSYRGDATRLS